MLALTVIAEIRAKPDCNEEIRASLLALIEPTQQDKGMLNYDLHESVTEPGLFIFHENWESRAYLDEHLATEHIQNWISQTRNSLRSFELKTLYKISK